MVKKTKKKQAKKGEAQKSIEIYKHKAKRKNNPLVGTVTSKTDSPKIQTKKYSYNPDIDPKLEWAGKAERLSFEVPSVSLHVHERIDPRSIIETVRARNSVDYEQMSIFHDPEHIATANKDAEFYKHEKLWANRMIAGDSLLVMNSLLEKEGMAGQVQCVYIDPPYGIEYGSNFQPFTNKKDVKDRRDADLTTEPEMLRAFRDTWELGIHSYLTYMRDRLLLARKLLTQSGSCFVQISNENVHLIRSLMDEIFEKENYMSLITYRTKTVLGSKYLGHITDYIVWFAKNKSSCKFKRLFVSREIGEGTPFTWIEEPCGKRRKMTRDEKINPNKISKKNKIFRLDNLISTGRTESCVFELNINGKKYMPLEGRKSWKTNKNGMKKLIESRRIEVPSKTPGYVFYYEDYPVQELHNVWMKVQGASDKQYVVQTSEKVIQRCLLMTTDSGDIVFDPTCGSGTTAYVAEQWGRRWITCDTSRVAIALAKQRLMTADFDYYELKDKKKGLYGGFDYKTVPHITLGSIANNKPAPEETLYDQPKKDSSKIRVTGPFTMEAVPAHKIESLSGLNGESFLKNEWFEKLKTDGVKASKGVSQNIEFSRLEVISGTEYIYAEGETKEDKPKRVIICFGSEYAPLEQRQIEEAIKEAKSFSPDLIIFCAFHFCPEASKDVDHLNLNWTKVLKVQMNSDLFTSDLKKKIKGDSFWLIGQPDIFVWQNKEGKYIVEVKGFDYYDTKTNSIEEGGKGKIAMWMLDTNYDEKSVYPRQIFFPISGAKQDWTKLKITLGAEIDEDLINKFTGTESIPFELGSNKKIAVKIIDNRGIESLVVKSLK